MTPAICLVSFTGISWVRHTEGRHKLTVFLRRRALILSLSAHNSHQLFYHGML